MFFLWIWLPWNCLRKSRSLSCRDRAWKRSAPCRTRWRSSCGSRLTNSTSICPCASWHGSSQEESRWVFSFAHFLVKNYIGGNRLCPLRVTFWLFVNWSKMARSFFLISNLDETVAEAVQVPFSGVQVDQQPCQAGMVHHPTVQLGPST